MATMTIADLRKQLDEATAQRLPDTTPVRVWLPGSTISLTTCFAHLGPQGMELRIEGNREAGQ